MNILYNNLLETATLSATNEDANYPVENVYSASMRTQFRADTNSSVITCTLAEASTVSCFAFGNHNIDTLSIQLTDSLAATTTYNYTSSDLIFDDANPRAMIYEDAVDDVEEIEYTITSTDVLFIGELSAGAAFELRFNVNSKSNFDSTDEPHKSKGGVIFENYGEVLELFGCTINNVTISDYNTINAFFAAVKKGAPHFVDRWPESSAFPVIFANQTRDLSYTKGTGGIIIFDSLRLEWEECK